MDHFISGVEGFSEKYWFHKYFYKAESIQPFQSILVLSCTKCNDFFDVSLHLRLWISTVSLLRKELALPIADWSLSYVMDNFALYSAFGKGCMIKNS